MWHKELTDEILKSYPKEKIKKFLGDKGSIIVEDTFGLHKGFSPKTKSRMMLILIYGEGIGIDLFKNPIFV